MIYQTIPKKYLVRTDEMIMDDFIKFINGDKYTPENHFIECVSMLAIWLEHMQVKILDCETSEEMRCAGNNMIHLQKAYEYITNCMGEYFSRDSDGNPIPKVIYKILLKTFIDKNRNYELKKELTKILTEDGNDKPTYSSDLLVEYINSPHVSKVLEEFDCNINIL
jgi:hypothetical protein